MRGPRARRAARAARRRRARRAAARGAARAAAAGARPSPANLSQTVILIRHGEMDGGDDLDAASFTTEMDALDDNVLNADERAQWAARPPETVLLKAGHVAFHHALTVHGSFGNRSDQPRRATSALSSMHWRAWPPG